MSSSQIGVENGTWECRRCGFRNQRSVTFCSMCADLFRTDTRQNLSGYLTSPSSSLHRHETSISSDDSSSEIVQTRSARRERASVRSFPHLFRNAVSGAFTGVFAIAGALGGAVTGALAGHANQGGVFHAASVGAVAGAVLSLQVLAAFRAFWLNDRPNSRASSSVDENFSDIFRGRFFQGQSPYRLFPRRQPSDVNIDEMSYDELYEMFGPGDTDMKGASEATLQALPWHTIKDDMQDVAGQRSHCPICLQEFELGEDARSLPRCSHLFHRACLDQWLRQQGTCPVCRLSI